ncbi:MAG: hypothetical protein PHG71_01895 [Kiritimatiellae bacterium]|nr:hypothetical protein [Kiritimatiellia bacterium]
MDIGIVIAVSAGCLIGLGGGVIGTWASIRNTSSPRERAFVIRASWIMWAAGGVFLSLMLSLPTPWRFLLWIPYGILLPLGIFFWNRTQRRIREEECGEK